MGTSVSTVTSKFQVTLPERVRKDFKIGIGQKIRWEVQGELLVGKRLPSIMELAGCLKSDLEVSEKEIREAWPKAAAERDERVRKQK